MSTASLIVLLHTAMSLYTLSSSPELPSGVRLDAKALGERAMSYASNALAAQGVPIGNASCSYVPASGALLRTLTAATKSACVGACNPLRAAQPGNCLWRDEDNVMTIVQ